MTRTVERDRSPSTLQPQLGGTPQTYHWQWQGQPLTVAYETVGEGDSVLLLPAFSTVSNRAELQDLAAGLASRLSSHGPRLAGFWRIRPSPSGLRPCAV
jgi:hypothetical protein